MNIWLLQTGEQLPLRDDVRRMRTALLADALVRRGHTIVWWASAFDHMHKKMLFAQDSDIVVRPGWVIKALRGTGYRRNVSIQRYVDHRVIAAKFHRLAPSFPKPNVIVASLPDHHLAYEAVMLARRAQVPVLVDVRDPWPDYFLDVIPKGVVPLAQVALCEDFRRSRAALKEADGIVSMMSDLLNWGLERAGRPPTWKDRVFYLGAPKLRMPSTPLPEDWKRLLDTLKNKFVVTFVGTFGAYYSPVVLIKAAQHLGDTLGPNNSFAFVLAGDGALYDTVAKQAQAVRNVLLPGWLDNDKIATLLSVSSVGILPANLAGSAFPNKAFTYLSAGLPVIASVEGDLKHLLAEYQAGCHFEPNDYRQLADLLRQIADDRERRAQMASNAQRLFEERLDADHIYSAFADHVEAVASTSL